MQQDRSTTGCCRSRTGRKLLTLGQRRPVCEQAVSQHIGQLVVSDSAEKSTCDMDDQRTAFIRMDTVSISKELVAASFRRQASQTHAGQTLDYVVDVAGSRWFFGGIIAVITGWAVAGIVLKAPDLWQIILQDVSSIQCYISDIILMRQQFTDTREHLRMIAILRSRSHTVNECFTFMIQQGMLHQDLELQETLASLGTTILTQESTLELDESTSAFKKMFTIKNAKDREVFDDLERAAEELDGVGEARSLAPQDTFDKVILIVAEVVGSIWMLTIFVIGIVIWICLGPKYSFSNEWQLWLNTCTALQQTLTICLLTLARARHDCFVEKCMGSIFIQDCELEYRCRNLIQYEIPNKSVGIEWQPASKFERSLDWYAGFVGSGYMVILSFAFLIVWLGIGHPMQWGDNWWLIIGTYTGLVGTFNAAVLRYSLYNAEKKISDEYAALITQDKIIFDALQIPFPNQEMKYKSGPMTRISLFFSWACATPWAVVAILALIIALLVYATAVLWNETAQLVVNSVTMIVESFFLIVLISAHNLQATEHRIRLHDILMRRLQLLVIHKRASTHLADSYKSGTPEAHALDLMRD